MARARKRLDITYQFLDKHLQKNNWALGDTFSMADCAAAPALYYANRVQPFGDAHENVAAYLRRLLERPSFIRVLREAEPYFKFFPG